jgi:hypothetical protein
MLQLLQSKTDTRIEVLHLAPPASNDKKKNADAAIMAIVPMKNVKLTKSLGTSSKKMFKKFSIIIINIGF